jgi:hypothetical protein
MSAAMIGALGVVGAALVGGPVMWFLARLDRHNTQQHDSSLSKLNEISLKVDKLDSRFDDHIQWHMKDGKR